MNIEKPTLFFFLLLLILFVLIAVGCRRKVTNQLTVDRLGTQTSQTTDNRNKALNAGLYVTDFDYSAYNYIGDSVSVAILIYALSKITERKQKDMDYNKILSMLNSCISNLKNNEDEAFRKSIKNIFDFIRAMDAKLKLYINEVINQAQIKKGCKLCEHGISVARASEVLGISRWELMHYIGKTTIIDQFSEPVNASQRLKFARSLFS